MKKRFIVLMVFALAAMLFVGCYSISIPASDLMNPSPTSESTGTVEVRVTDGPPGYEVQEVEMEVGSVEIHMAEEEQYQNEGQDNQNQEQDGNGNWIPLDILEDINPFILTDLQNGKEQTLALGHVDPGKYTQIRMGINWVEINYTKDGEPQDPVHATLNSGKLKFVRPFNVEEEETTVITFDFIVDESVVFAGAKTSEGPKVIFKPVIKLDIQQGGQAEDSEELIPLFNPTVGPVGASIVVNDTGWIAGESIDVVTVGGVIAAYTLTVDVDGNLFGTIVIPVLDPGIKDIVITGTSSGERTFTDAITVIPTAMFVPISGPVDTSISVIGAGWATEDTIDAVAVGGEAAIHTITVDSLGNLAGTITVPVLDPGIKDIVINGVSSGEQTFTDAFIVIPTAAFTPTSGPAGTVLTVTGTGWVTGETFYTVTVGGVSATYALIVDGNGNLIGNITVPLGLTTGPKDIILIGANSGEQMFPSAFEVT